MTRRKRLTNDNGNPGLDISSLIDVSFLLLIYFLITSTLDQREGDLDLTMPGRPSGMDLVELSIDIPLISVDAVGVVSLEAEVLETDIDSRDLVTLEDRLNTFVEAYGVIQSNGDPMVKLQVDDSVPGQRFIDVMNCLAGAGISNVVFVDFGVE